jgi:uncharacterized protein
MVSPFFNKLQVLILLILIPLGGLYFYAEREDTTIRGIFEIGDSPLVHIGEIPINVEIVDTPLARTRGLSGRTELRPGHGMLFVFDTTERHSMWMKDMNFPIDIIWISEDLKVVGIERAVSPDSYPKKFFSPLPARYAVETVDRLAETFGINVGDPVRLPIQLEREREREIAK